MKQLSLNKSFIVSLWLEVKGSLPTSEILTDFASGIGIW